MSKYSGRKRQLLLLLSPTLGLGGRRRQLIRRVYQLVLKCVGLLVLGSASFLVAQAGEEGPQKPGEERVAICFYGLTRSLKWTLPSIRRRMFDVLRHNGMELDVFVHTYHLLEVRCECFLQDPSQNTISHA